MNQKILLSAVLALSLLLSACGGKPESEPDPLSEAAAYTAETAPCDLPMTDITASCASGGVLYLAGTVEDDSALPESDGLTYSTTMGTDFSDGEAGFSFGSGLRAVLCRLDPSTGEVTPMDGYVPASGASVAALAPGADGSLWVLEQVMEAPDDLEDTAVLFDSSLTRQVWRQLSADGSQELAQIDMTQDEGDEKVTSSMIDSAGRLYFTSGNTVNVLDGTSGTRFTCNSQDTIDRLISLSDGAVGAVTSSPEGSRTVLPIDPDTKSWGTPCPLTGNAARIFSGDESYEFLYTSGDSLYGWPKDSSAPKRLLSWSGAGIDCGQVSAMTFLPDGRGAALLRDASGWPVTASTALLSPASPEEMASRTVLTLATMGLNSETRAQVIDFNRTSGQYRIEIQDYSEWNTADDTSAGLTKLNTEILAGKMPDLLDVSGGLSLRQYAAKGYLEDLWPYIESAPELGRAGVMERALQSAEIDGKLYQIFPNFSLKTLAGASSAVGSKTGWTLEDLKAALAKQKPECGVLGQNETSASLLETLFGDILDQFVDWDAGTVRFDSPEFQEILAFCASFPAQPGGVDDGLDEITRAAQGGQLLLRTDISSLSSLLIYRTLFGGEAAYVGYPGVPGGGAKFQSDGGLALSAACRDKDGAWTFLRKTLLPTGADFFPYGFPINREDFDRAAADAMKVEYAKDENGDPITGMDGEPILEGQSYGFIAGRLISLTPVTQADYDQFMALYNTAESLDRRDENIWKIVQECAGAYFSGDKGLEDTASTIQNRVMLYVSEQM